jgi:hypothetical protein
MWRTGRSRFSKRVVEKTDPNTKIENPTIEVLEKGC